MSEHNKALHMAQKLLRKRADNFPKREISYQNWGEDPRASAYRQAADELDVLIYEEVEE